MTRTERWERYNHYLCVCDAAGLTLDVSRMSFDDDALERLRQPMQRAFDAMHALERGAIANPDEQRMVGHYWLRTPQLAPTPEIRADIAQALEQIRRFARDVQDGVVRPQSADGFYILLVIGIGGSALGPQFVSDALGRAEDAMIVKFVDNTDPDGIDRTLAELAESLNQTLVVVISKSGSTPETRNGMVEVQAAFQAAGLDFTRHAVAITAEGSKLHQTANTQGWLRTFPMWDWVGGRTSETSAVGLVPAALQGIDIDGLLEGARACDAATRVPDLLLNPAALLAAMWHLAGEGRGTRNMVVLPYKDRLALFGKYLQQLVMESLGKQVDRAGRTVHQGLTVFGNKGSTDQHSYIQQLREGPDDFFAVFIEVLKDRARPSLDVGAGARCGDYLNAFLHGTRNALSDNGRQSLTITIEEVTPRTVGALIALFERAVGLYAELVGINAYHQPGVEAGKKAAEHYLMLQQRLLTYLRAQRGQTVTPAEAAAAIGAAEEAELVYHVLRHAAANPDHAIAAAQGTTPDATRFKAE